MTILGEYLAKRKRRKPIQLKELERLHTELQEVIDSDQLSWEEKYDLVFETHREKVCPLIDALNVNIDWYDPDTTYEEDATAYVNGFGNELIRWKRLFEDNE